MFITKRKHDAMMAIAGREIVDYQFKFADIMAQRDRLRDENASLRAELAALRAIEEKRMAPLRQRNAERKAAGAARKGKS